MAMTSTRCRGGTQRDAQTAKLQSFGIGYNWSDFNLTANPAQM